MPLKIKRSSINLRPNFNITSKRRIIQQTNENDIAGSFSNVSSATFSQQGQSICLESQNSENEDTICTDMLENCFQQLNVTFSDLFIVVFSCILMVHYAGSRFACSAQ